MAFPKRPDFDHIPLIDISGLRQGGAPRAAIICDIADACERVGFLVISGHGVDPRVIAELDLAARRFFQSPLDERMAAHGPGVNARGYGPARQGALARTRGEETPPDLRETFSAVRPDGWPDWYRRKLDAPDLFAPNRWPTALPEFEVACRAYYHALETLADLLMGAFAEALDLPTGWFNDKIDQHMSKLMIANYPAQTEPPLPSQLRSGAHTDWGSFTVVYQDGSPGGLQVRNSTGDWIDIPATPGAFAVNIGDLLARWTNDRWVSTLHRVVNPPFDIARTMNRQSLIFFHQPNYDAIIECIPTCRDGERPPRHAVVTSGGHLAQKAREARGVKAA